MEYETIGTLGELRLIRQRTNTPTPVIAIDGAESAAKLLRAHADRAVAETFWVIALDCNRHVIGGEPIPVGIGTLDTVATSAGDILRAAFAARAHSIIIAHNHPGLSGRGQPEPSDADVAATKALVQVAAIAGIHLLDHIILGDDGHTSLAERGVIEEATTGPHPVSDLVQRGFTELDAVMAALHRKRGQDVDPILYKLSQKYAGNRARGDTQDTTGMSEALAALAAGMTGDPRAEALGHIGKLVDDAPPAKASTALERLLAGAE